MFAKIVKGGRRDKSKMKFSDSTLPGRLSVALNIVQCGIGTGPSRSRCVLNPLVGSGYLRSERSSRASRTYTDASSRGFFQRRTMR